MKAEPIDNSELYPEAWKIFVECVRKWEDNDLNNYPYGWRYGIPNPENPHELIYSECPRKLFVKFKDMFYESSEIVKFRRFLLWLEMMEGKLTYKDYKRIISHTI